MYIDMLKSSYAFVNAGKNEWLYVSIVIESQIENDVCTLAKDISLPYSTLDYNMNGDPSTHTCNSKKTRGVWYQFSVDHKQKVYVSTCSATIVFDSYIEVVTGTCDKLTCLTSVSETENCNGGGLLEFDAAAGNLYKIFIGSEEQNTNGKFDITMWTNEKPENSKCSAAYSLDLSKKFTRFTISTTNAYVSIVVVDEQPQEKRGAYIHIPDGYKGRIAISTCATGTRIPTFIALTDNCRTSQQNTSFINTVFKHADYLENKCGDFGSYLIYELDGTTELMLFVGNANTGDTGFIDVEILNGATDINPTSSSQSQPDSSSHPHPPEPDSSSHPHPPHPPHPDSSSSTNNNQGEEEFISYSNVPLNNGIGQIIMLFYNSIDGINSYKSFYPYLQ